MNLPPLPKQHKKKEADFGLVFREWIEGHPDLLDSSSIELKHTRGRPTFNLKEWKKNQRIFAYRIRSEKGCLIRVEGLNGEPDYNWYRNAPAYLAIKYPKGFVVIDTAMIPDQKSLTYAQACAIAHRIVHV